MVTNFSTTPSNIMPGLQMFGQGVQSYAKSKLEQAKEQKGEKLRAAAVQVFKSGDPDAIATFVGKNPGAIDIYKDMVGVETDAMLNISKKALLGNENPFDLHIAEAEKDIAEGKDPAGNIEMARALAGEKTRASATKKHEQVLSMLDPEAYKQYKSVSSEKDGKIDEELKIGSQEILEDGTIIQSTQKGPVVYNPEGKKVTGKDAAGAVEIARAQEIENAQKKAGGKTRAVLKAKDELQGNVEAGVISKREAAKISIKAFGRLEAINKNIGNLKEGIGLLRKEGANTGVVDKYLPSIKKASIKMDNLQGRLGLDVLNTTTFGALSAGELKFALDTAVPKGLQPNDLADWMQEKMEAQEKLSDYLESVAIYMGTPGNTAKSWIEKQRAGKTKSKRRVYNRKTRRFE